MSDPERNETRRDRAERLFDEARALRGAERVAFIDDACRDDDALRAELTDLLRHTDAAEGFFTHLGDSIPAIPLAIPLVAGRYEVHARLGAGGMGIVYRARDRVLQRDVALKFLPPHLANEPEAERTLLREARAAAGLEHANICSVHEVGSTEDGRPFISMTLYEGESLKDRLSRGPLPIAEIIDIARQLASGLAAAHEHGIVHRDVKPGNVMILRDGSVKLLDFGLARPGDAATTNPSPAPGTVAYMSPEQLSGHAVGPASDLFSLGVVLYEMVTGVRPFRGDTQLAVMEAISHDEPEALRHRRDDVPRALERIVARLLEKRPGARYASAREFLSDLDALDANGAPRIEQPERGRFTQSWLAVAAILLVAAAGLTAVITGVRNELVTDDARIAGATAAPAATALKTVAVLPFRNVRQDPDDDYLVDGLTEELIAVLSRVRSLRVVARTSAFLFRDEQRDIREIGRMLGVDAILEGSVQRSGDRVRVRAQLINVADGLNLWAEAYDREVADIFTVQRDLALRIAGAMQAGLSAIERESVAQPRTVDPEAYNLYLKGLHFWNQRTSSSFELARDHYERAIAIDPGFASAYAGLAAVYSQQGVWGVLPSAVARERMREAATQAVALDDDLAEAHSALGVYMHVYEWDSEAAEREQLRAIALDPTLVTARYFYGNLLRAHGRYEESLAQHSIAADLDPLDPLVGEGIGRTLLLMDRPDDARKHLLDAIELNSRFWYTRVGLGRYFEARGQFEDALREMRLAHELGGPIEHLARLLARTGHEQEARAILQQLTEEAERTGIHTPEVASSFLALGDDDAAFAWLEQSFQERHPMLRFIAGHPEDHAFKSDPRYSDFLRRIGLRR